MGPKLRISQSVIIMQMSVIMQILTEWHGFS